MELLPGIHQINVNYKNRPLQLYLLRFGTETLLMDTGDSTTPPKDILPYFQKINLDPKSLAYILLTHPDIDHVGGLHAMHAAAPHAKILCGTLDREQIETPEGLANIRARAHYHWHQLGPDDEKLKAFIQNAGGPGARAPIHQTFNGGETLQLGDRQLSILHLPGHSHGHLGVFLPWLNTAITGDAVQLTANRFLDGRAAFAPTYMDIDAYLGTIDQLHVLHLDNLFSCHWPNCTGNPAVERFLAGSRTYALHAEQAILETLKSAGPTGLTLKELCTRAKPQLGDWPPERDPDARSMICGHLQRLCTWGLAHLTEEIPTRYLAEPTWRGLR